MDRLSKPPKPSFSDHRKVLIIEDDASIRNMLYALVAGLGCDPEAAYTGSDALAKIGRERFDAVLIDLRCVNLHLDEVLPAIHNLRPSLVGRILVITGDVVDLRVLDLIEEHFLLELPKNRLLNDVQGRLRAVLCLGPPTRVGA